MAVLADCRYRLNGHALTVIGQAYGEDLMLLMNAEGHVYGGGCDEFLYRVATSGEETINIFCLDLAFEML